MNDLTLLPNIGSVLASELISIGIHTSDDLVRLGSVETFIKLVGIHGKGCYNKLYALEGAIQKVRWHSLTETERKEVKKEYERFLESSG